MLAEERTGQLNRTSVYTHDRNGFSTTVDFVNNTLTLGLNCNKVMGHVELRPYIMSTQLIQQIMQAAKPMQDPQTATGLKWIVEGSRFDAAKNKLTYGVFELVIDPETHTIWHFLFRGH